MEKMMVLKAVSEKKQREIQKTDGTKKVIAWYEPIMSNGLDTIIGETSEALTGLIDNPDPNFKLELKVGTCYMCRFSINVVQYEKNNVKSYFTKIVFHQIVEI